MSFNISLTGLNAVSEQLDTVSNNIANVGTVGFKSSRTEFGSVYADSQAMGVEVLGSTQSISHEARSVARESIARPKQNTAMPDSAMRRGPKRSMASPTAGAATKAMIEMIISPSELSARVQPSSRSSTGIMTPSE